MYHVEYTFYFFEGILYLKKTAKINKDNISIHTYLVYNGLTILIRTFSFLEEPYTKSFQKKNI